MAYIQSKMKLSTAAEKEAITMVFFLPKVDARNWKQLALSLYDEKTGKIEEFFYGIAVGIDPDAMHEGFDLSPTNHTYQQLFELLEKDGFFPLSPIQGDFKKKIENNLTNIIDSAIHKPSLRKNIKAKIKSLAVSIREFVQSYIAGAVHPDTWRKSLSNKTVNTRKWKDENSTEQNLYAEGYDTAMYETGQLHDAITDRIFLIPVSSYVAPIIAARHKGMIKRYEEFHKKHPKIEKPKKVKTVRESSLSPSSIKRNLLNDELTTSQVKYLERVFGEYGQVLSALISYEKLPAVQKDKKVLRSLQLRRDTLEGSLQDLGWGEYLRRDNKSMLDYRYETMEEIKGIQK